MHLSILLLSCALWVIVPTLTLISPPLDVLEMLVWGHEWQMGYYKHPPLPPWLAEIAYRLVGDHVWGVYALSQFCVAISFYFIYKTAKIIFDEGGKVWLATLFLMGIYYYVYPTPEFNHNVLQLPLWAAFTFFAARIYILGRADWIPLGMIAGLAMLTKYSCALMILIFLLLLMMQGKRFFTYFKSWLFFAGITASLLVFLPHLVWLIQHDFLPLSYVTERAGGDLSFINAHLWQPLFFMGSQLVNCSPALIILFLASDKRFSFKAISVHDPKSLFLTLMCFGPCVMTMMLGVIFGLKLLPMWGMPFWGLLGIWLFYHVQIKLNPKFYAYGLLGVSVLSAIIFGVYHGLGYSERRSLPTAEIVSELLQDYAQLSTQPLGLIISDEWVGGNLALKLPGRPSVFLYNDRVKAPWVKQDADNVLVIWKNNKPNEYPKNLVGEKVIKVNDKLNVGYGFLVK